MQEHLLAATQVQGGQEVTLAQELQEVTQGEHLEVTQGLALHQEVQEVTQGLALHQEVQEDTQELVLLQEVQEVQEDTQELVLLQEVQEDTLLAPEVIPEPSLLWILK